MELYCGLDLSIKSTSYCIVNSEKKIVSEGKVATEVEALQGLLKRWEGLKCVVEAAPLAEWMCQVVEDCGHKIDIVCPRKAKPYLSGKKKTDARDARGLAELCRVDFYEPVHRKSEEARAIRSFMVARKQLVDAGVGIVSSIRGLLRANGVKLVASSDEEHFEVKVKAAMVELPRLVQSGIRPLLATYLLLRRQQRRMYRQLQKWANENPVSERLMSIPGVGAATAVAFVATIDEPKRFKSGAHVASYLGLVPSVNQSGEKESRGKITKQGDVLVRWLLVEAAHVLLTRSKADCELKEWGLRLREAKGPGKARVAVARKLAGLMWVMWLREERFRGKKAQAAA